MKTNSGSQMYLNNAGETLDSPQDVQLMYDLIARMLDYDPTARMNLRDAIRHEFFDKLAQTHPRQYPGLDPDISRHILRLQI